MRKILFSLLLLPILLVGVCAVSASSDFGVDGLVMNVERPVLDDNVVDIPVVDDSVVDDSVVDDSVVDDVPFADVPFADVPFADVPIASNIPVFPSHISFGHVAVGHVATDNMGGIRPIFAGNVSDDDPGVPSTPVIVITPNITFGDDDNYSINDCSSIDIPIMDYCPVINVPFGNNRPGMFIPGIVNQDMDIDMEVFPYYPFGPHSVPIIGPSINPEHGPSISPKF